MLYKVVSGHKSLEGEVCQALLQESRAFGKIQLSDRASKQRA